MTKNELLLIKVPPRWLWVIAIVALSLLTVSLWLPYGFNLPGSGDEWPFLAMNDMGIQVIGGTLRPFVNVPAFISYHMSPDSFLGMNIGLAIMSFGRGLGIYYLLRRLTPQQPDLALVGGGLAVVYMGDNAFYGLVMVSITTALVFFLISLIALIDYWHHPRWFTIILMWAALAFSVGIYEVSFPLILAAPLILFYWNAKFNWRLIKATLLWYLVPLIYILINVFARLQSTSLGAYQVSLFDPNITLPDIVGSFAQMYVRVFGQVWQTADTKMPQAISDGRIWLVMITLLVIGLALFFHKSSSETSISFKKGVILIAIGLIGFGLAYSPFSITIFARNPFRTLLYALPFASIALATLVFMLTRLKRIPRVVIALLCVALVVNYLLHLEWLSAFLVLAIALGFLTQSVWRYAIVGAALVGFASATSMGINGLPYPSLPDYQQRVITTFAKQAPAIQSHTLILWTGTPGTARQYTIIRNRSDVFESIVQFVFKRYDIEARMCNPDGSQTGDLGEHCRLERDAVVIDSPYGTKQWTYDRVIAFVYDLDKGAVLLNKIPPEWMSEPGAEAYNPEALIDHNAPLPYRLKTVWTNPNYSETDPSTWQQLPPW